MLVKAVFGVVLAVGLFYAGWYAATELQYDYPFSASSASASATAKAYGDSDAAPVAAAPSGAAATVSSDPYASTYDTGAKLVIDGNTINVALSTTTAEIDQGLQDRPTLGANDAMLFIFSHAAIYQFWMPNMSFPLDMIWIGSDKKIVDITRDAPPLPDPSKPVWFRPSSPAQYVLEVNANYAKQHNISIGDAVQFVSI